MHFKMCNIGAYYDSSLHKCLDTLPRLLMICSSRMAGWDTVLLKQIFEPTSYLGCVIFQRFALAASELNGVIYTSGGYDGDMYLE